MEEISDHVFWGLLIFGIIVGIKIWWNARPFLRFMRISRGPKKWWGLFKRRIRFFIRFLGESWRAILLEIGVLLAIVILKGWWRYIL